MDWIASFKKAIDYVEQHLTEDIKNDDIAKNVNISSFYFQQGFKIMTGYTLGEYIRNRKLYFAALDVIANNCKIIDIAYKYNFSTPESFTKSFSRFHGVSPINLRKNPEKINIFLPLKISISIVGGYTMDYKIEKMSEFKLIGIKKRVKFEDSYGVIPKLWDEVFNKLGNNLFSKDIQNSFEKYNIGEFGVCIVEDTDSDGFDYMIAGKYDGDEVPEGLEIYEVPEVKWAKFRCVGPLPEAFQTLNTKIFKEWLPVNDDYKISLNMNIEWYSMGDCSSRDYESGIWIPVVEK